MPTAVVCTSKAGAERFILLHACLIPAAIALLALLVHAGGADERVSAAFFDASAGTFPARGWPLLEALGHRVAKSALVGLWIILLGAALTAAAVPRLRRHCGVLWATVLAMALGPTIVVTLKSLNAYHCPWDLKRFGGVADYASGWFVSRINAGRCFPSGHAAGGFSLVAIFFAGCALGSSRMRQAGLTATLIAGSVFSLVRIAQGAHFLSHNLWSAAIDWCTAALVFAPMIVSPRPCVTEPHASVAPSEAPAFDARFLAAVFVSIGIAAGVWVVVFAHGN